MGIGRVDPKMDTWIGTTGLSTFSNFLALTRLPLRFPISLLNYALQTTREAIYYNHHSLICFKSGLSGSFMSKSKLDFVCKFVVLLCFLFRPSFLFGTIWYSRVFGFWLSSLESGTSAEFCLSTSAPLKIHFGGIEAH